MPRIPLKTVSENRDTSITFRTISKRKRNLEKIAIMRRSTVTDIINCLVDEYNRKHWQEIEYYDNVFGDKVGDKVDDK